MKTKYILSILLLVLGMSSIGQTVYTPWGTAVNLYYQGTMSASDRHDSDLDYANDYPNAYFHPTLPGYPYYPNPSSTMQFNCHGYAWYMFWLGSNDEFDAPWNMAYTEAQKYFNDPSFVECSESEADIVWYNTGSHSALTTTNPLLLKSKWNTGPLATHGKGALDSPHPLPSQNNLTYYKLCYKEYTIIFNVDETRNECSAQFENSSISNYVDLDIEYEEAVRFKGTFSTGTGSTLYIHPD